MRARRLLPTIGNEPIPTVVGRILKTGHEIGLFGDVAMRNLPAVARIIATSGLGVRSVHAIQAAAHPHRTAMADDRRHLTYSEANAEINRVAHALLESGVRRGDRVVLMMENRTEYIVSWFALFRLGIAAVHASYRSTPKELSYLFEHSGARTVIGCPRTIEAIREFRSGDDAPDLEVIVAGGVAEEEEHDYDRWLAPHPDAPPERGSTKAQGDNVVYTSGTTGKPKGAVRDFYTVGIVELTRLVERLPMTVGDRHLLVAPLYHSGGQAFTLLLTSLGGSIYVRPHFDAEDALRALSDWRIHSAFMVPTMIRRILDLPPETHRACPTPDFRALVSGAAMFPHELRKRAIARFGPSTVHDFYGATELGWITLADGHDMMERPGTVGRPLAGQEVAIFDENAAPLPPGEVGTIYVRNEQTMSGYLDDPGATAETERDGWYTVDDLGRLDDDGYLYLAGRDRDMIISGGVNIYPVEIEEEVAHHPGVDEVAVVGVPHDDWGEEVVAFVVPEEEDSPPGLEELDEWTRERLASFKVPRRWIFVDELPRNPTGKVLKRTLRDQFADGDKP